MEEATPFFIWRKVFDELFGLDPWPAQRADAVVSARVARLDTQARATAAAGQSRPAHVVSTDGRPTAIPEQARRVHLRPARGSAHRGGPERSHLLLVVEQARWMDSPSIALAARFSFARRCRSSRRARCGRCPRPAFDEIQALARSPRARRFVLDALAGEQIVEIACRALGVSHLPPAAGAAIAARADGNPLLAQEVAAALRDTGLLQIVEGECRLSPGAGDLRSVDLPTSIEGAVTARLDRLASSQRLLLKVGSVVGRVFEWPVVLDLLRRQGDATAAGDDLRALETAGVVALERSHPEPAYIFRHLAFQEITYRQMLFSQRRQLHQAIGEILEARHAGAQAPPYPRLALHWRKAVEGADADKRPSAKRSNTCGKRPRVASSSRIRRRSSSDRGAAAERTAPGHGRAVARELALLSHRRAAIRAGSPRRGRACVSAPLGVVPATRASPNNSAPCGVWASR
jgi:hypothetical protein